MIGFAHVQQNSTERIKFVALDANGVGVTGASVALAIRRDADGWYWNGAAFAVSYATVAMAQTDATNLPGYYHYDFVTSSLADATYTLRVTSATASVVSDPAEGELKVGGYVDEITESRKLLGNNYTVSGSTVTVKDDDGSTTFRGYTVDATQRTRTA